MMDIEKLPKLPDLLSAGMGLTEALAFWNRMMNTPEKPASYWWDQLLPVERKDLH